MAVQWCSCDREQTEKGWGEGLLPVTILTPCSAVQRVVELAGRFQGVTLRINEGQTCHTMAMVTDHMKTRLLTMVTRPSCCNHGNHIQSVTVTTSF